MKRAFLIGSIVIATAAYGQGMSGHDSQNGQVLRGQHDGHDHNGGRDGRGGYHPPRPPHYPPRPPHYPQPAMCTYYAPQQMCTGNDIAIWMPPYVNRHTSAYDCMDLCNRQLRQMNWSGYACCQLQQHPDHPANCRLRDGMPVRGGSFVGAASCMSGRY